MTQANQYTDRRGRTWSLTLDLPTALRIDKSDFSDITDAKFSILKPGQDMYRLIVADAHLMFAVIWAMVQDQAAAMHRVWLKLDEQTQNNILDTYAKGHPTPYEVFPLDPKATPDEAQLEFVAGVHGPTIVAGRRAFVEALSDFFPEHRTALSMLLRQTDKATEKVNSKMVEMEPELEKMMDEELEIGTRRLVDEIRSTREKRLGETSAVLQRSSAGVPQNS